MTITAPTTRSPRYPALPVRPAGAYYAFVTEFAVNRTFPKAMTITINCPFCGETHTHGWNRGEEGWRHPGQRVAHCGNGMAARQDYVIVLDRETWKTCFAALKALGGAL